MFKILCKNARYRFLILVFIFIFVLVDCRFFLLDFVFESIYSIRTPEIVVDSSYNFYGDSDLSMYVLSVGQAESILLMQKDKVLLIDAATPEYGPRVVSFLKSFGITKIDILISTHPHYDHLGGMSNIIRNFEIGDFYASDVDYSKIHRWWFYKFQKTKFLKGINWKIPKTGDVINFADSKVQFLATGNDAEYKKLNDSSIACKISYNNIDFLLAGDGEYDLEQYLLNSNFDLSSEVYLISHHGSYTSSSKEFLDAIFPQYALLSVGNSNKFGHPHSCVMKRLKKMGVPVYRTDECDTIILKTDGNDINFFESDKNHLSRYEKTNDTKKASLLFHEKTCFYYFKFSLHLLQTVG